jgi:hypothetical protein
MNGVVFVATSEEYRECVHCGEKLYDDDEFAVLICKDSDSNEALFFCGTGCVRNYIQY